MTSHGHHGVSYLRQIYCLFNRLFTRTSKKTSKFRVPSLCEDNPPVISGDLDKVVEIQWWPVDGFPSERASCVENVSIRCHHELRSFHSRQWRWHYHLFSIRHLVLGSNGLSYSLMLHKNVLINVLSVNQVLSKALIKYLILAYGFVVRRTQCVMDMGFLPKHHTTVYHPSVQICFRRYKQTSNPIKCYIIKLSEVLWLYDLVCIVKSFLF